MHSAKRVIMNFNSMILVCLVLLAGAYTSMAQVGLPKPQSPTNKAPVPKKLPPSPQTLPGWSYQFALSPTLALNKINGTTNNQTIRDPYISASVKDGSPVFHIFYHPKYNGATPWKWKMKDTPDLVIKEVTDVPDNVNTANVHIVNQGKFSTRLASVLRLQINNGPGCTGTVSKQAEFSIPNLKAGEDIWIKVTSTERLKQTGLERLAYKLTLDAKKSVAESNEKK